MIKFMPDKIASVATYCVSGSLVCGGSVAQWFSQIDWNKVAVIVGILIAVATYLTNAYYKSRAVKAYEASLKQGLITPPPQQD